MSKLDEGKQMLEEVAARYAGQHGLRPKRVSWEEWGDAEWLLRVETDEHSVKTIFSREEIEDFPGGAPGTGSSKGKLRNAFASLAL